MLRSVFTSTVRYIHQRSASIFSNDADDEKDANSSTSSSASFHSLSPRDNTPSPFGTLSPSTLQPSSQPPPQPGMRRELDATKHELSRTRSEVMRLEDRCKLLERTIRETKDLLRQRDVEIDRLRGENARAERRRSEGDQDHRREQRDKGGYRGSRDSFSSTVSTSYPDGPPSRHSMYQHSNRDYAKGGMNLVPVRGPSSVIDEGEYRERNRDSRMMSHQAHHPHHPSLSPTLEQSAHKRSLDTFLTKTDAWSGAQVIQAVHDLNSEILQFAASASELCTYDRYASNASSRSSNSSTSSISSLSTALGVARISPSLTIHATHETTARLGPAFPHMLSSRSTDHPQDPILVQLALQGCISSCIARSLSVFCMGFQSKSDVVLQAIYSHIFLSEPQPTSSRWRALTHRHIHNLHLSLDDYATNELAESIFRWSADIFIVAGCRPTPPTHNGGTPNGKGKPSNPSHSEDGGIMDTLRRLYTPQIHRIARAVTKLTHITREEIMSTNFDLVAVDYTSSYNPDEMTDAFGEYTSGNRGDRGAVLCTTELGLRCTTRVEGPNHVRGRGGVDKDGVERRMLLLPKVLLESALDVL